MKSNFLVTSLLCILRPGTVICAEGMDSPIPNFVQILRCTTGSQGQAKEDQKWLERAFVVLRAEAAMTHTCMRASAPWLEPTTSSEGKRLLAPFSSCPDRRQNARGVALESGHQ